MTTYIIYHNGSIGSRPKSFKKAKTAFMNSIWNAFNKYAKANNFIEAVKDSKYFGALAWKNPHNGDIIELRKVI